MRLKQQVNLSIISKPIKKYNGDGRSHHKNRHSPGVPFSPRDGAVKRNAQTTVLDFLMRHDIAFKTHLSKYKIGLDIKKRLKKIRKEKKENKGQIYYIGRKIIFLFSVGQFWIQML